MNANADKIDAITLYKKSHKGNIFSKKVSSKDWKSDIGYDCRAVSTSEREKKNLESLQKLNAVKAQFPDNPAMNRIYGKKILEFGELNADEVKEVMEAEAQKMSMGMSGMAAGMPSEPQNALPQPVSAPNPLNIPTDALQPAW